MRLPSFVVIGAMKSGTTALHLQLVRHPEVFLPERKEVDFFVEELNWPRGPGWYAEQFAPAPAHAVAGEISPNYTKYPLFKGVPDRLARTLPDARLVYLMRHPVERMRSHWLHQLAAGRRPTRPAARALLESDDYLHCSSYGMQLQVFLEHFPREHVLLLRAEDFRADADAVLSRICRFIGVDPSRLPPGGQAESHRTEDKRVPRPGLGRLAAAGTRLGGRPGAWLHARATAPAVRALAHLPPAVVDELANRLGPDLELLCRLAGPDFEPWDLVERPGTATAVR